MPRHLTRREFAPVAELGDVVLLLGTTGFRTSGGTAAFEVIGREALPILGAHGAITIWTNAGGAVATYPYTQDAGAAGGVIAAGAAITTQPLQSFKNNEDEVTQLRFLVKVFGTLGSTLADDFDVRLFQPGSSKRYALANVDGVLNMMVQGQLAADSIALPASGANITLPATYQSEDPFDKAYRSELFVYRDESVVASITNTNAANATATSMGIALMAAGFKYTLRATSDYTQRTLDYLGMQVSVPSFITEDSLRRDVPILQVAARS